MAINIKHYSDTIAQDPNNIAKHDTSVERLRFYYETLAREIGVDYTSIDFIGSEYGNSFQTAAQAVAYLQSLDTNETQVVLINNAARSKHSNSNEAKGSYPLWCQVEIAGTTHHIVGVDDDAFELVACFQKAGTTLKQISSVHYGNFHIEDTSKGSQFRSKDYYPLIQLLFLKHLQERGSIQEADIAEFCDIIPYELGKNIDIFRAQLLKQIGEKRENLPRIEDVVHTFLAYTQNLLGSTGSIGNYEKSYIAPEFKGIEKVQIVGEFSRILQALGVEVWSSDFARDFLEENKGLLSSYFNARRALANNELLLIDRDKFGNCIFATSEAADSLDGLLKLDYELDEELNIEYPGGTFTAILTQTISDKTGKNCVWQSSSSGPLGEKFLNINTSFSHENSSPIAELQNLPIGSVVRFQGKKPRQAETIQKHLEHA